MAVFAALFPTYTFAGLSVRRHARRDAKRGLPLRDDATPPPTIEETVAAGSKDVAFNWEKWARADAALLGRWGDALLALDHALAVRTDARATHARVRDAYEAVHGAPAPTTPERSATVWTLLLVAVAVLESFVNYEAFFGIGDGGPATVAAAISVTGLLLGVAHLVGHYLAHTVRWSRPRVFGVGALAGTALMGLATIGYFRYLGTSAKVGDLAALGIEADPLGVALGFFAINAMAFAIGVVVGHLYHRPFHGELLRTRVRMKSADRAADRADRVLEKARSRRLKAFEEARGAALWVQEAIAKLVYGYWRENLIARTDLEGAYPSAYHTPAVVRVPPELRPDAVLDWPAPAPAVAPRATPLPTPTETAPVPAVDLPGGDALPAPASPAVHTEAAPAAVNAPPHLDLHVSDAPVSDAPVSDAHVAGLHVAPTPGVSGDGAAPAAA